MKLKRSSSTPPGKRSEQPALARAWAALGRPWTAGSRDAGSPEPGGGAEWSGGHYEIRVVGAPPAPIHDFYHVLLRLSWTETVASLVGLYLFLNAIFATLYWLLGGLAHARAGAWSDAFFFSVQTMGTIGYGAVYPESTAANLVVVMESTVGIVYTALTTGLVFAKFSRPTARLIFSKYATVGQMDGRDTLSFRVGNGRGNRIVDAVMRLSMVRTEVTKEGKTFYRVTDLKLTRERNQFLSRSWTAFHVIDEDSPLVGETAASLATKDAEIMVSVSGMDDTFMQVIHGYHRYMHFDVLWGHRHADVLSERGKDLVLDLTKFHAVEPDVAAE